MKLVSCATESNWWEGTEVWEGCNGHCAQVNPVMGATPPPPPSPAIKIEMINGWKRWRVWPWWTRNWPRAWACTTSLLPSTLIHQVFVVMVIVMVMVITPFRFNSASVPLLLPLELPALPQPRLHHGLDVHPLQLVQRPVQHVHPRSTQLFWPPGSLIGTQPSAAELKPLKRGGREEICDTKKEKHIPKTP